MRQTFDSVIKEGTLVESIRGRDRGRIYLILKVEPPFVYGADGVYRSAAEPKKKRATHVRRWSSRLTPVELDPSFYSAQPAEKDRQIRRLIEEAAKEVRREVTDA